MSQKANACINYNYWERAQYFSYSGFIRPKCHVKRNTTGWNQVVPADAGRQQCAIHTVPDLHSCTGKQLVELQREIFLRWAFGSFL